MSRSLSEYQAKYYAYLLTRKAPSNDREKLIGTILDAKVEPKPHQIEAALFAFRSPFSKGAILADEVGLRPVNIDALKRLDQTFFGD